MLANTREEIVEVLDACDAAVERLCELRFEVLSTPERMAILERLETVVRRLPVPQHQLLNQLAAVSKEELGDTLRNALADRLRITTSEAGRRIGDAADLGERVSLTGEPLAPRLEATAAAQRRGRIGSGHVNEIRDFVKHLPTEVDAGTREQAEADLAGQAAAMRPDQLKDYALTLLAYLHPDGEFSDDERARKRGLSLGKQDPDGMSKLTGWITPALRAALEAAWAKLAAPGIANPEDHLPHIDEGEPDPEAVRRDTRGTAQRQHDGLHAGLMALLASGDLGQHHGLPVTIVVTTTLAELEAGTGTARTGGGSLVPMSDVIRWSGAAHPYLALFDGATPLALYHTKRLANRAQRLMLYARDRGCTRPGCTAAAYHTEVHHLTAWHTCLSTHITNLALACGIHNRLAEHGWTTRTNHRGLIEWLPPAHHDRGQPRVNTIHHPERLFAPDEDNDDP
ncbi:hypothetical protein Mkiyose1665_23610 [Mycobacterium kiyosense]|uniref:HNH endonuclease signature motif containing protein n=13 Tax=Mycobacterium kiyosense TaxID=2871094 RepID=UPI00216C084D|nr:HNH endonuclease signature motif containing protein [Mycobacterium kiyosense]GLD26718.1 hypothetical protein Mkiyose1386_47110 [Mycobacterium kiyosense]GLD41861.1 hypothetical protein Mkiyose1665_23610 [Mycobacterium kiyosense]